MSEYIVSEYAAVGRNHPINDVVAAMYAQVAVAEPLLGRRREWFAPMLRVMEVELYPPMLPSRPCRFCLSLQGDSVFADFDVDPDGRVFAVRVSFDGYGCCDAPADIGRMNAHDSDVLLSMVKQGSIDSTVSEVLRVYFRQNRDALWSDALARHGLI